MSNDRPLSYGDMIKRIELADTDDKPAALTIKNATRRNMAPKSSNREDWKIVIEFAELFDGETANEKRREYVVNSTSYKTLADRYGTDETRWVGKAIVMAPTKTTFDNQSFEKLHVATPDRWDKVLNASAKARGARK